MIEAIKKINFRFIKFYIKSSFPPSSLLFFTDLKRFKVTLRQGLRRSLKIPLLNLKSWSQIRVYLDNRDEIYTLFIKNLKFLHRHHLNSKAALSCRTMHDLRLVKTSGNVLMNDRKSKRIGRKGNSIQRLIVTPL